MSMWSEDFLTGFHSLHSLFMNPEALIELNEEEKLGYHMAKSVLYNGGFILMDEVERFGAIKTLQTLQKRWGSHYCRSLERTIPASKEICWFCSPKVKEMCAHRERPKRSTD